MPVFSAPDTIFKNLKARYHLLGINLPDLHSAAYIKEFIANSNFPGFFDAIFPKATTNGEYLINQPGSDSLDVHKTYTTCHQ